MDEEKLFEEQPQNIQPSVEEDDLGSSCEGQEDIEAEKVEAEGGVTLGKFKNTEELLKAYNNLQAQFTKKSQKLAEVMKDKTPEPATSEQVLKTFLSNNQEAVLYADELKSRVGDSQSCDEGDFRRAWADILYEKLSSKHKAEEPIVQNFVKDDEIQEMVIKNYVKQLSEQKTPVVISSNSGERLTRTATAKPDSFEDAKRVVLDMFS